MQTDADSFVNNGFDVENQCVRGGQAPAEQQCCGEYPHRFPYRPNDEFGTPVRGCCGNKTFDVAAFCCSNSDEVLSLGSC